MIEIHRNFVWYGENLRNVTFSPFLHLKCAKIVAFSMQILEIITQICMKERNVTVTVLVPITDNILTILLHFSAAGGATNKMLKMSTKFVNCAHMIYV